MLRPAKKIPYILIEKSCDFSAGLETEVKADTENEEEIESNSKKILCLSQMNRILEYFPKSIMDRKTEQNIGNNRKCLTHERI